MKYFLILLLSFCIGNSFAQKAPISGVFRYSASLTLQDSTTAISTWKVVVRTNDTISRVETDTDVLGTQVYIRHMAMNKAYLLLEMGSEKFAIQTDLVKKADTARLAPAYTMKKLRGSKKIAGLKCVKYQITYPNTKPFICYYAKKIPNKYLEVYAAIPGLAVDYYLPSEDGLMHYVLQSFEPGPLDRDLFGVPSDYKRITFDEFMHRFYSDN